MESDKRSIDLVVLAQFSLSSWLNTKTTVKIDRLCVRIGMWLTSKGMMSCSGYKNPKSSHNVHVRQEMGQRPALSATYGARQPASPWEHMWRMVLVGLQVGGTVVQGLSSPLGRTTDRR